MKFKTLKKITLEEFVELFTNSDLRISQRRGHWLYLIRHHKLTCPATKKKVEYCALDEHTMNNGNTSYHYNFYSKDDELFSIDHKLPISKGGSKTSCKNIQPMIMKENHKKSNTLIYID